MQLKRMAIALMGLMVSAGLIYWISHVPARYTDAAPIPSSPQPSTSPLPSVKPTPVASTPTASPSAKPTTVKVGNTPNPKITPGATVAGLNIDILCLPTYGAKPDSVSAKTAQKVFASYGLDYAQNKNLYAIDLLIPIGLGGSTDIKNMWPQSLTTMPGFNEKNEVEAELRQKVCTGSITLQKAQQEIKTDWTALYK